MTKKLFNRELVYFLFLYCLKSLIKKGSKIKYFAVFSQFISLVKRMTKKDPFLIILKSIENVGFATTANIFSQSDTAKIGGKVGWVKETSLSKKILKNVINLKKGQISKPIKINENFLILTINDTRISKQKIDKNKILSNRISYEKNQQLERFSLAYFIRIKQNIQINEL